MSGNTRLIEHQDEQQLRQQRTWYLQRLDVLLRRHSRLGTAFVDANGDTDESWAGLLVWDIAKGAETAMTVRCDKEPGSTRWVHRIHSGQGSVGQSAKEPAGGSADASGRSLGEVLGDVNNLDIAIIRIKGIVLGVTQTT